MKRKLLSIICIALIIGGCSRGEENNDLVSIAESGIKNIQPPKSCQIVDIGEDEIPISWEYNKETDDSQNITRGITRYADVNDTIYAAIDSSNISYYSKNNMSKNLLCGKPECEHNSVDCNSYFYAINELQYYNGSLYTVEYIGGTEFKLKKISLDGAVREDVGNLLSVEKVIGDGGGAIAWIIHRGYIYYQYRCGSGETEDTYYLNNSNCIYRMNLESKEKECIMVLPYIPDFYAYNMRGVGSYVYISMPKNEDEGGYLYRFNTETKQLERLESLGGNIGGYAVCDDRLYYLKNDENERTVELYCFEYENKENRLIEIIDADGCNMYCDDDYIYVYISYNEFDSEYIKMYDKTCNYITDIGIEDIHIDSTRDETVIWAGTDSERIYFTKVITVPTSEDNIWGVRGNGYYELYYIEKSKLLKGETEMEEFN